ncbi:MAG: hypothetical protein ACLUIL_06130 [Gallintestinimicrobium sp.]|uniref:hypothetical protein n=1 Tax=Gallintestinimicrobium sp. TaxID=2981655 RepID=UPI003993B07A
MKQFSYMLHTIFHYAPGESAAYLAAEIMSCLISFLQLILLQSVVDSFLQNSLGSGIWQGVLFLLYRKDRLRRSLKLKGPARRRA